MCFTLCLYLLWQKPLKRSIEVSLWASINPSFPIHFFILSLSLPILSFFLSFCSFFIFSFFLFFLFYFSKPLKLFLIFYIFFLSVKLLRIFLLSFPVEVLGKKWIFSNPLYFSFSIVQICRSIFFFLTILEKGRIFFLFN